MKKIRSPFRTIPQAPKATSLPAHLATMLRQQSEEIDALVLARKSFINGALAGLGITGQVNIDLATMTYTRTEAPVAETPAEPTETEEATG